MDSLLLHAIFSWWGVGAEVCCLVVMNLILMQVC
jgi:hypothetical protein